MKSLKAICLVLLALMAVGMKAAPTRNYNPSPNNSSNSTTNATVNVMADPANILALKVDALAKTRSVETEIIFLEMYMVKTLYLATPYFKALLQCVLF